MACPPTSVRVVVSIDPHDVAQSVGRVDNGVEVDLRSTLLLNVLDPLGTHSLRHVDQSDDEVDRLLLAIEALQTKIGSHQQLGVTCWRVQGTWTADALESQSWSRVGMALGVLRNHDQVEELEGQIPW